MESPDQKDLERFIHEQLQKLPEHEAPANLLQNVLNAIAAQENLPWWKQPFTCWPRNGQMLLYAVLATTLGSIIYFTRAPAEQLSVDALATRVRPFAWVAGVAETLVGSFLLALRNLPWTWLAIIGAIFMIMYVACIGTGLALYRVTAHRPLRVS